MSTGVDARPPVLRQAARPRIAGAPAACTACRRAVVLLQKRCRRCRRAWRGPRSGLGRGQAASCQAARARCCVCWCAIGGRRVRTPSAFARRRPCTWPAGSMWSSGDARAAGCPRRRQRHRGAPHASRCARGNQGSGQRVQARAARPAAVSEHLGTCGAGQERSRCIRLAVRQSTRLGWHQVRAGAVYSRPQARLAGGRCRGVVHRSVQRSEQCRTRPLWRCAPRTSGPLPRAARARRRQQQSGAGRDTQDTPGTARVSPASAPARARPARL